VGGLRIHKQLMWLLLRKDKQGVGECHGMFWQGARRKTKNLSEFVDKILVCSEEYPCWEHTSNKKEGPKYETCKYI
jgi:hypothetical protein